MGAPKPLLTAPDGQPFMVRICRAFTAAGVARVTVVTGAAHQGIVEAVAAAALPPTVSIVRNPIPAEASCRPCGRVWRRWWRRISRRC